MTILYYKLSQFFVDTASVNFYLYFSGEDDDDTVAADSGLQQAAELAEILLEGTGAGTICSLAAQQQNRAERNPQRFSKIVFPQALALALASATLFCTPLVALGETRREEGYT